MDQQNSNSKNRNSLRTDESVVAGQSEKIKKFFKALAVLVVFFSSFSVPMYLSYKTQEKAKEMRVKMEMSQLRNWATVYELENNSYDGLENNKEIKRVFEDIKSMGGNAYIFVSKDHKKYCCQTNFLNKSLESWCVDYTGTMKNEGKCDKNNIQCE